MCDMTCVSVAGITRSLFVLVFLLFLLLLLLLLLLIFLLLSLSYFSSSILPTLLVVHFTSFSSSCFSSIMEMASLLCCVKLENLNVAHNSLYGGHTHTHTRTHTADAIVSCCSLSSSDLPMFLQSVRGCFQLKSLDVSGNLITQENKYRWAELIGIETIN